MEPYRVTHTKSGDRYYVLADAPAHAVEIVTLRIGDVSGRTAWTAEPDEPAWPLSKGTVLDRFGKPIYGLDV